jgi:serine/threonine protein kinase
MTPDEWSRIQVLFHDALERPQNERAAFLDAMCADDPKLRHHVELLIGQAGTDDASLQQAFLRAVSELVAQEPGKSLVGRMVGHYEILALAGRGGMGQVYRARDTHLDRVVAIKVLRTECVGDANRRRRFVQEAKSASALNHPNIVTVHDIACEDGLDFMVMEFVAGKSLDQMIGGKGLKLGDALHYGVRIADALAAAHAAGIVHRDLKPANVMVGHNGAVKVLDFGLAKLAETPPGGLAKTLTAATEEGSIVGTPAYMSPEQAEGKKLDTRSDIFSFGAVLYEMVTGQRAFQADSVVATLAAILHEEPKPISALRDDIPPELATLITRCLRKDPQRRTQSMADLRLALEELRDAGESSKLQAAQPPSGSRRLLLWPVVTLMLLILLIVGALGIWRRGTPSPPPRSEWVQLTDFTDSATSPALSPDGRMLTFIRGSSTFYGPGQIYVKLLPEGEPVPLTRDSLRKMSPMFSPDGSRIAYTAFSPEFVWDTWVVPALGGKPQLWVANASGLVWIDPRRLLFSEKREGLHMALVTAAENRVGVHDVYVPPTDQGMAHRSYVSPDRKWVLLAEMDHQGWLPCRLIPFDGGSPGKPVGPSVGKCTNAAWSADGQWMYMNSDAGGSFHIYRQHFPDGKPEQITSGPTEEEGIALTPDGRSLITSVAISHSSVWISDRGVERQISSEGFGALPGKHQQAGSVFSPDGKRLFYLVRRVSARSFEYGELWAADLETGRTERMLADFVVTGYDISSDGKRVFFSALDNEGKSHLWLAALDRRSPPEQLPAGEADTPAFGPSGDLFFRAMEGASHFVFRMKQDGSERRKAIQEPIVYFNGISPDGAWAITRTPAVGEVSTPIVAYPLRGGPSIRIADNGFPFWSRDRRLFYLQKPGMTTTGAGETYAFSVPAGRAFPDWVTSGIHWDKETEVPGLVKVIEDPSGAESLPSTGGIFPGPDLSMYAFLRRNVQRNLYRIPLP